MVIKTFFSTRSFTIINFLLNDLFNYLKNDNRKSIFFVTYLLYFDDNRFVVA